MKFKIIIKIIIALGICPLAAQEVANVPQEKHSKAWELGLGGSVYQFSRISFSNFEKLKEGYQFDLSLKQAVFGLNVYAARELNQNFYLDIQGTTGFVKSNTINGKSQTDTYFMVGPGIQWRLGEYFGSHYIDPYLRLGASYMRQNFPIHYQGTEGIDSEQMEWILDNINNKAGKDRKDLLVASLGAGVNMWLNDRWGIGLQADYLLMPYKDVANSLQGTVRLMWRIGGKSKKSVPQIEYVDVEKVVERIVEKPVVVEKIVEVPGKTEYMKLYESFNNINFEFDRADLTPQSKKTVCEIADILKDDKDHYYLITGFTDSRGSSQYNEDLSRRRAATVVNELVNLGVPKSKLKSRGVGSRISYAEPSASDIIRNGDRKVTIEIIGNLEYWNFLPSNDL